MTTIIILIHWNNQRRNDTWIFHHCQYKVQRNSQVHRLIYKQVLEKPGYKSKMFKSAGSHAGPLKGLRRASWSPQQMHAKPSLGKYATALLHSPDCTLNFQLSPIESGNQMVQTSIERKPPRHTNTAFASMSRNWGCSRKGLCISLKALIRTMFLLVTKINCMIVRHIFVSVKHPEIISLAAPFSQSHHWGLWQLMVRLPQAPQNTAVYCKQHVMTSVTMLGFYIRKTWQPACISWNILKLFLSSFSRQKGKHRSKVCCCLVILAARYACLQEKRQTEQGLVFFLCKLLKR